MWLWLCGCVDEWRWAIGVCSLGDDLSVQGAAVNRASRPGETHWRHGQAEQQAQAGGARGPEAEHRVFRLSTW